MDVDLLSPRMQITRRAVATVLATFGVSRIDRPSTRIANAAVVLDNGAEAAQRAAALLPGYGPPDARFPPAFGGRWRVLCRVVEVRTPQGEQHAPAEQLRAARAAAAAGDLLFDARFIDTDGGGGVILQNERDDGIALGVRRIAGRVIADRGFNAEQRAAAASSQTSAAAWEPGRPNVLTLTSDSGVTEIKVIKRLVEEPAAGAFGTSEFARYTSSGTAGDLQSSPAVFAQRVQTKYKWEPAASAEESVRRIEAIELAVFASGFGDPAGATPLLVVKSRLTYTQDVSVQSANAPSRSSFRIRVVD